MKITKSKLKTLIIEEMENQVAPSESGNKIYVVELSTHDGRTQASFKTPQSAKRLIARLEKYQKFVEDNRRELLPHELMYYDKETGQKFRFSHIYLPTRIHFYTMRLHQ